MVRRARWRTADQARASTAAEETAHGVHAPAGDVLAKRPDWQAWRRVWGGRHGPARGLRRVAPANPAAAVRGPKHVVTKGSPPVLAPAEARKLLDCIDRGSLAGTGDEAGGLLPAGEPGVAQAPREGGGGGTTSQSVDRARERLTGRLLTRRVVLGDDQAPVGRGTASAHDVLPHVPGDGDHGVWGPSSTRSRSRGTRRRRRRSSMTARLTL